jgi:hypothetical protein
MKYLFFRVAAQGCQIFVGKWYQNRKNVPKERLMYKVVIKYPNWP